jgi:hypothetical protein
MVTEKQLVANRENAKKGGPKTAEGKAMIRLNALKRGLFAKDLVELEPQSMLQEMLIECMVSSFWRRQMAIRLESDYLNEQKKDTASEDVFTQPENMSGQAA